MSKPEQTYYSRRNPSFLLYEMLDVQALAKHAWFDVHDRETMDAVLDTVETIARLMDTEILTIAQDEDLII